MLDLPPASIFEKIAGKDEDLVDRLFDRTEEISKEATANHYRLTRREKLDAFVSGAASLFGQSQISRPTTIERKSVSGRYILSNAFRQAMTEIVEESGIPLTPKEKESLQPLML